MSPRGNRILIGIGVVVLALMYLGDFILSILIKFGVTNDDNQGVEIYHMISIATKSVGWFVLLIFVLGSFNICEKNRCYGVANMSTVVPVEGTPQ